MILAPLDSSPEPERMPKSKTNSSRDRDSGAAQVTKDTERKRKRETTAADEPEKIANDTTGKWFPSTTSDMRSGE